MFVICDVKGAEMEASAIDKDNPMSACFKAPQSLAPSPHMATRFPIFWNNSIALILSLGFALANTVVLLRIYCSVSVRVFSSQEKILSNAGPVIQSCTEGDSRASRTLDVRVGDIEVGF